MSKYYSEVKQNAGSGENGKGKKSKPDFYFAPCAEYQPIKILTPKKNMVDTDYGNHILDLFHPEVFDDIYQEFTDLWDTVTVQSLNVLSKDNLGIPKLKKQDLYID